MQLSPLEAIKNNREIIIHKNTNVKSIICITHGAIFKKIKDACTQYNICKDSIIDCCKGRRKEVKKLQCQKIAKKIKSKG